MTKYEELKKIICEALPRLITYGKEPFLSDVLEVLNDEEDFTFFISSTGRIFKAPIYEGFAKYEACCDWNLSQPLLKDQSEELIDYLLTIKK